MQGHHHSMVVPLLLSRPVRGPGEPMDSFGSRLRHERERRQIALKSIAESTKIGIPLLEGLERDDVSRWPRASSGNPSSDRTPRPSVSTPEPIVREFVERYPDPLEVDISPHPPSRALQQAPVRQSTNRRHPPSSKVLLRSSSPSPGADRYITRIGRLADWKIVRFLSSLSICRIFQSANLPMLHSPNPHESGGAAPDQAPPA